MNREAERSLFLEAEEERLEERLRERERDRRRSRDPLRLQHPTSPYPPCPQPAKGKREPRPTSLLPLTRASAE